MMQFLKPTPITDAQFVSSTRAENDHAAWSNATTYAEGDRVILTSTHRIYYSVQAGNLNHNPATDDGTWWLDIGPTNRWAMFDNALGTVTAQATPLTVVLDTGIINAIALLDIAGTRVDVTLTDGAGGPSVYARSFDIADDAVLLDWWMYFFDAITPASTLVINDLPPYISGRLTVSIVAGVTAECGTLAIGEMIEVGEVRAGARLGIIDYSRKETDEWGSTYVQQRAYAKRFEVDVTLPATSVDYVARQFAAIRATPVIWIGDTQYESLIAYGWLRDWGINISYPTHSDASITIEGLT
jgi:hypothetical protein